MQIVIIHGTRHFFRHRSVAGEVQDFQPMPPAEQFSQPSKEYAHEGIPMFSAGPFGEVFVVFLPLPEPRPVCCASILIGLFLEVFLVVFLDLLTQGGHDTLEIP